jgi:hypothetical protein
MFGRKTAPTNELDQIGSELASQRKELSDDSAQREQLKAAVYRLGAEFERARAELHQADSPERRVDDPPEKLEQIRETFRATRAAQEKATTALSAHEQEKGDLIARGKQLRGEEEYLEQQRVKAADYANVAEIVELGCKLKAALDQRDARLQEAYRRWSQDEATESGRIKRGAGLHRFIGFPGGIFTQVAVHEGWIARSIFQDHLLVAVFDAYPDLVPPELAAVVAERAEKRPRNLAIASIGWNPSPHLADTPTSSAGRLGS